MHGNRRVCEPTTYRRPGPCAVLTAVPASPPRLPRLTRPMRRRSHRSQVRYRTRCPNQSGRRYRNHRRNRERAYRHRRRHRPDLEQGCHHLRRSRQPVVLFRRPQAGRCRRLGSWCGPSSHGGTRSPAVRRRRRQRRHRSQRRCCRRGRCLVPHAVGTAAAGCSVGCRRCPTTPAVRSCASNVSRWTRCTLWGRQVRGRDVNTHGGWNATRPGYAPHILGSVG